VERGADGRLYNTSILFDSQGNLQAVYRKIHLFGHDSAEKNLLCPGSALTVVRMPQGCVGLATCYDLRFPELFRQLTDRGAEAFAVVAAWPERRVAHWIVLSRARALENLAYVIACNMSGVVAETRLGGHSLVADPWGAVVAEAGEEEQVLYARLDWDHLREIRRGFPALADRRL
jgi:predicted amidohydrolase